MIDLKAAIAARRQELVEQGCLESVCTHDQARYTEEVFATGDIEAKLDNIIDRVNNLRRRIDDLEDLVRALTP